MKTVRVILSPEAEETYRNVQQQAEKSKPARSLSNAIQSKADAIKANSHYGDPIAKPLIPAEYKTKYGITNLFRVKLPQFWRMRYHLTNADTPDEVIALVVDIIDHPTYDKKFGYRGN